MGILNGEYEIKNIKSETIITPDWCKKVCSSYPVKHRDIVKKVVISKNVKEITHASFYSFTELKEVTLPQGLKIIGDKSFCDCGNLEYIEIPDSVEYIGAEAFADCKKLRKIKLPAHLKEIKNSCFSGCVALESIEFPENITSIGDYAFKSCINIKFLKFPEKLEYIGEGAFCECKGITEITIPYSVRKIDSRAFAMCENLEKFELPKHFEAIPKECFVECNIKNLIFDRNIKVIKSGAFFNCPNLKSITFHRNIESIEENAFSQCWNLSEVTIYDGTDINIRAFDIGGTARTKKITLIGKKESVTEDYNKLLIFASGNSLVKESCISYAYYKKEKYILSKFLLLNYYETIEEKNIGNYIKLLIDYEDVETITKLLENFHITSEVIDEVLEHSIQTKKAEIQVIFSNYKNKYFGFESSDSFDKFLL